MRIDREMNRVRGRRIREHVKKLTFLADVSAKAFPPPPRAVRGRSILCIFFTCKAIYVFETIKV